MKFEDVIIDYLWEQVNPPIHPDNDNEFPAQPDDAQPDGEQPDDNQPNDADPNAPEPNAPEPNAIQQGNNQDNPEQPVEPDNNRQAVRPPKKPSATALMIMSIKTKWAREAAQTGTPITEAEMDGAIAFFNDKKGTLRPLSNPPNNLDISQLFALHKKFPNFPAYNANDIRNISSYTWEQINFLMERYLEAPEGEEEENVIEVGERLQIRGESMERILPRAYEMWKGKRTKLYDANNVSIIKIESQEQSVSYGVVQNCLRDKNNRGSYWCTTIPGGSNYANYRTWRSFYYVLNENVDDSHPYHFFAIGAVIPEHSNGPYTLASAFNENYSRLTFDDLIANTGCQDLNNVRNKIVWFNETQKESVERIYDSYTFNETEPRRDANGNVEYVLKSTDFSLLKPRAQLKYIQAGKMIKSAAALKSLPEVMIDGQLKDLQKEYVISVSVMNFKQKFITIDPDEDVFAMLSSLRTSNLTFLDKHLKMNGIPDGKFAVIKSILNTKLKRSYRDIADKNKVLYQTKDTNKFGIFDVVKMKWDKPLKYKKDPSIHFYRDTVNKKSFGFIKYVSADDYFYVVMRKEDWLTRDKDNPNRLGCQYVDGQKGDELIGRMAKL